MLAAGLGGVAAAQEVIGRPGETPEERDARMSWWREARFGMFIHWGVYAVPAGTYRGERIGGIGEWIMNRAKIPVAVGGKDWPAAVAGTGGYGTFVTVRRGTVPLEAGVHELSVKPDRQAWNPTNLREITRKPVE
jgi:hypothetical protein